MTSLAVSLSIDCRGPCGIYIITDSRITWGEEAVRWDAGQKTFASRRTSDIFGYCGDAFFPPAILRQLIDQVDSGLLFADSLGAEDRHLVLLGTFRHALARGAGVPIRSFSLFHGARDSEFMASRFRLWETQYDAKNRQWTDNEYTIANDRSYLAHVDGTGKPIIKTRGRDWIGTDSEGTSRAAIWSFCDALHSGKDPLSGGPPQLVGIWRKGPAQSFGMLWHGKRYLSGLEVSGDPIWTAVPWFNNLFERCDGKTGSRIKTAQRHRKPVPRNETVGMKLRKAL